jgi:rubrerythrin
MEHKQSYRNPFAQNDHDKAQDAIDRAREVREKKIANRGKTEADPILLADGKLLRCSLCGYPIRADEKPSVSVAFAEHLLKGHQPD